MKWQSSTVARLSPTVPFAHKLKPNALADNDSCHSATLSSQPPSLPLGDAIFLTSATLSLALPIVFDSKITS